MHEEQISQQNEIDVFGKRGITLSHGKGAVVYDDQGKAYLDCVAGHGTANIGHGNARVAWAVAHQAARLTACPGSFYSGVRAELLQALARIAPDGLTRTFFCNSGTESVEAALKFARITTGRSQIVAAKRGFHGRTYGAMSATFNPHYALGSEPLVPGFRHVRFNDIEDLAAEVGPDTAAVILEVVQGEGGVHLMEPGFARAARSMCDRYGAMLIFDEVQTGFGRTGRMFACEHLGIVPDLMCLAKSMAGGLPMGAVMARDTLRIPLGRHGSTFAGNPVACAAALATLAELDERGLCKEAEAKGHYLADRLRALHLPIIREIRYLGLMFGIELRQRVRPFISGLAEEGVLALSSGATVLRLLPPLVIERIQLDSLVEILARVLSQVEAPVPA